MSSSDEAVILAGGFGTRLQSVVSDVPKPLAPIRGRPFVSWLLDAMADQGMRKVVLATGHLGDLIVAALGTQWRGMTLAYSHEREPLGTGGAIAQAARQIQGDAFFVINGDTWLELDYRAFDKTMREVKAPLGMALASVADTSRYGAVNVEQGFVESFVEKGRSGSGYINAGVYRLERKLLPDFPSKPNFSFETEVLLPAASRKVLAAYTQTRDFLDIGVPDDYLRAQENMPMPFSHER
ncbi:MAG TPA: nucleotidyltransferase family protein [Rhodanobacter sp.]